MRSQTENMMKMPEKFRNILKNIEGMKSDEKYPSNNTEKKHKSNLSS